jgi:hypothetical protein
MEDRRAPISYGYTIVSLMGLLGMNYLKPKPYIAKWVSEISQAADHSLSSNPPSGARSVSRGPQQRVNSDDWHTGMCTC